MAWDIDWALDLNLYLCVHEKSKRSLCFGIYPSLSLTQKTECSAAVFVLVIRHWPITNYFIILRLRLMLGKTECFPLFHFFSQSLSFFFTSHSIKLFTSRQVDQYSAALVCQEGITVPNHFSPSAQKHHYALPSSNRAGIPMVQAEFHYPKYFTKMELHHIFALQPLHSALCSSLAGIHSDGEPCGLVSHKNCWAIWLSYQATDGQYKDSRADL